jgi:ATP-dependent DNA helicase RecQ
MRRGSKPDDPDTRANRAEAARRAARAAMRRLPEAGKHAAEAMRQVGIEAGDRLTDPRLQERFGSGLRELGRVSSARVSEWQANGPQRSLWKRAGSRWRMKQDAQALLSSMLGPGATFRPGQWEAIRAIVERRSRVMVVQQTGWGKSLVYFIATKLLREQGSGTTLLISPLLSLMRNQQQMASRTGLRALHIASDNTDEWVEAEAVLAKDSCDILLVSPERLANHEFISAVLPAIPKGIGLFVVDEAHCISDWGHDFRPDYRRVVRIVQALPSNVPVLATTATANDRVVEDVVAQLGSDLQVLRGPLSRASLRLQTLRLAGQTQRLAWLAEHLPSLPGSGIIYCLTIADCDRVSAWLAGHGIDAPAYHSRVPEEREALEQKLLNNEVKALVATIALGMGFDKPDLGFVVHYQRPGSVVSYYQQIGRAGRNLDEAFVVLLSGREDDEIQDYFIRTAFPGVDELGQVLHVLESSSSMSMGRLLTELNLRQRTVQQCLRLLEVEGAITRDGNVFSRTVNPWKPDVERSQRVTALRRHELDRIRAFVNSPTCLMQFIARELDDVMAEPCGRCAVCIGRPLVPTSTRPTLLRDAIAFLKRDARLVLPRRRWPTGAIPGRRGYIPTALQNAEGRALSIYLDAGWGSAVRRGKYSIGLFGDDLVEAAAELVRTQWRPTPPPAWVTAIPSLRHPHLVPEFAARLADALGLQFLPAIEKIVETPEQKTMTNSSQQVRNIASAFRVVTAAILADPVLLVDDIVDSRWTLTLCGALLREAGSGIVYPLALATAAGAGDDS